MSVLDNPFCFKCFSYQIYENNQWRCPNEAKCEVPSKGGQKNIVLLPSTLNPRYLFPLPLAIKSWKKLGVYVIVLLIGKEINFLSNNQAAETIKLVKEQNAYIQFYEPQKLPTVSISQIIRLFASVLDFSFYFDPRDTVLITSDADLMVFNNLFNHVPKISEGKKAHFYSLFLGPVSVPFLRGNKKVPQFQMGTIGATIEAWREIMDFEKLPLTMPQIEEYIINEFGEMFFKNTKNGVVERGSDIWFADQSLISYKISEWLKKNPKNDQFISARHGYPRRINRNSWPTSSIFLKMNLIDFDDAHLPSDSSSNEEWHKFLPFLNFVFKDDQKFIQRFIKFRDAFIKQN